MHVLRCDGFRGVSQDRGRILYTIAKMVAHWLIRRLLMCMRLCSSRAEKNPQADAWTATGETSQSLSGYITLFFSGFPRHCGNWNVGGLSGLSRLIMSWM